LQFAEVHATHVRNGKVIFDGVIDRTETPEHALMRRDAARSRMMRRGAALLAVLFLAGVSHFAKVLPEHAIPAATVITNVGQSIVTNRMTGSGTEPKFVMWGTGAGTAAVTDTTLFTETTDEARTTGTSSRVTTTVTNDTYQVVGTITVATSGKTVTNVGLFDVVTASSGNLYFKSDFTGMALLVGDSITFTIKVKFS
jgi:hypothetical protein